MGFYDAIILPKLTHRVCAHADITCEREKVVPLAKGEILEVGIGSGLNLPFYDPATVDRVWGVDPSGPLKKIAEKKARKLPFEVRFIGLSGEDIPLEKNSMDTVLVTYALCSIPDVLKALKEMNRVLKPKGVLLFCEHGRAPDEKILRWQDRLNPVWTKISGGCNLNRPISHLIAESGFKITHLDAAYTSSFKVISFNYTGIAVPV
jgi:ubiquinone/menaquinone biosynthesis C-methylase UbiE